MPSPLSNRRVRAIAIQAAVLAGAVGLVAAMVLTARQNLLDQGIATGFGFLERTTGWPINFALIEVDDRSPYWRMLLAGLLNTLLVGGLGLVGATVVGVASGLARISDNPLTRLAGTIFVEAFRNVPLILQVIFWYAVLTHLPPPRGALSLGEAVFLSNRGLMVPGLDVTAADIGLFAAGAAGAAALAGRLAPRHGWRAWAGAGLALGALGAALMLTGRTPDAPLLSLPELRGLRFVGGVTIKPEFAALLIGITLFGGAYVGEIVRSGFLAVPRGTIEAARALGLRPGRVNALVRVPLAVRAMLPALANQYVWLMKATTLGIAIGYPDYFMVISTSINQSGQTMELIALLMLGFLLLNRTISGGMNLLNARLQARGGSGPATGMRR